MSIKRKKNFDEVQHVEKPHETSLSFFPLDEGEVFQPCFPPAHEVEEATSLNDEESEDPVEATLTYVPPAHEDKEMVIFSDTDGLMKEPLDMVDEHIDTFIQIGRRRWDVGHFIFYRDPIYDIEVGSRAKGIELSSPGNWSSLAHDSDSWQPDDDMITNLFHPFEDDLSPYTHDDSQSSLQSCHSYPFGDSDLFYGGFQPPFRSDFDGYKIVVIQEQPKIHIAKRQYFRHVAVLIHTYKRGEVSNPLGVSLEAQCLSPNPLSPRLGLLPSRLTPREAKGGRPYLLCKLINVI
jgi:hypothetical protein